MKSFAERNPIAVGIAGITTLVVALTAAFFIDDLPVVGGGTDYTADFADAANLKTGDDVRIAGVKVGSVDSIELHGKHVVVGFQVKDAWVGDQTTAAIGIKTVLGQEYVALDPQGERAQDTGTSIPLNRTSTPLDIASALSKLSTTTGRLHTDQLARALDTLSTAFAHTPSAFRSALSGLSRLSQTIASRDTKLQALARRTNQVSATLAANNKAFSALIHDGADLLQELRNRSAAITRLLRGTRDLAIQLKGLVRDNERTLGPALDKLGDVTDILLRNQGNVKRAVDLVGPYYTLLADATASGPWLDTYLCGLFDKNVNPVLDADAVRNCTPKRGSR